ncbi:glycosyltransferase family 25 protein [Hymenobacter profundi]|uniref:Glycosyltransferase family 25 protein n=1 Tax=Hymenobacter profundi TaxID=1982110 RepID=A0ABS6WX35_9BACT|nr:glycosyltransferase family 25 protein [Hymenobacter profundi]MBW3128033.1 glycosyltransferase family 25 protein [Hymenobacter profundi]
MKVFVINLKRSTERKEFIQKQLYNAKIEFEFVEGVDGNALSNTYLESICDFNPLSKTPYLFKKGVYGCALSHYNIYKKIVEEKISCALVLEDDVNINSNLKDILDALEKKIKENEVILLFSQNTYTPTVYSSLDREDILENYSIHYPLNIGALGSAAGYVITHKAAEGMVSTVLPIKYAADAWHQFFNNCAIKNIRSVLPYPILPAGLESNIDYISKKGVIQVIKKFSAIQLLLKYRRKLLLNKTKAYSIVDQKSPLIK